jgi:transcriptional regulator NrdR family protein
MKCPHCFGSLLKVEMSKHDAPESVIRQRKCKHCSKKFYTCEVMIPRCAFKWVGNQDLRRTPDFQKVKFTA